MTAGHDGVDYDRIYREGGAPWEIGGPQPAFAQVLDTVPGPRVLDLGCGTGELALALARRGHQVTGIDISPVAIEAARAKAAAEGLTVRFEVGDATRLPLPPVPFDSVFDSGLLHNLARHGGSQEYLAVLPALAGPGAAVYLLAVSSKAGQDWNLTEESLLADFAEPHWAGTRVERADVVADVDGHALLLPGYLLRTVRAGS
jgi:SAM-dependent methyltransferase